MELGIWWQKTMASLQIDAWGLFSTSNVRATSVCHIPIHGVPSIKDYVTKDPRSQFMWPLAKYIGGVDHDQMDMVLSNTLVVYDMDSEDEHWLAKVNNEKYRIQYTILEPFVVEGTLKKLMENLNTGSFFKQKY